MRRLVPRLAALAALLAAATALLAGCGGGGSSGKDPAEAAPPDSSVFIQATLRPDDEVAANVNSLAKQVAGISDVGEYIVEELESSAAGGGDELDFEKEVDPWLGDEAGLFLREYDGNDFHAAGAALQIGDEGEAEEFVEKHVVEGEDEELEEGSFEGVDYKVEEDGSTFGFTEGLLLFGEEEASFKEAVEALDGENLAASDAFSEASDEVPDGAVGDVFVDIGKLIEEAGQGIDSETQLGFEVLGIEPEGSTALISLVPGSDHLEMDVSSNASTGTTVGGDASALLEKLPAGSIGAFASAEYGKTLQEMVDRIDENGIPGELRPHEFKRAMAQSGLDLDSLLGSIGDVAGFAEGNSESNLGGAVVIETSDPAEAENTVKNLSLLLRATGVAGVSALSSGGLNGFSIRSDELGPKPLVVAVADGKLVISYGPKAATAALSEKAGTLGEDPTFAEAKKALGGTPISAFVDGPSALTLFDALASPLEKAEIEAFRPYLDKIGYLAAGGSSSGEKATATVIAGVAK